MTYAKYNFDAPTERVLAVLDAVATNGPCTLNKLAADLPFPRAAIWRALSTLKKFGWVRCRRGDHAYSVSSRRALEISCVNVSHPEVDSMEALLEFLSSSKKRKFAFYKLVEYGQCSVIEASTASLYGSASTSIISDDAGICALASVKSSAVFDRHVSRYMVSATADERTDYTVGVFQARIEKARTLGFLVDRDWNTVSIPIARPDVVGCSVTIMDCRTKPQTDNYLADLARGLIDKFNLQCA